MPAGASSRSPSTRWSSSSGAFSTAPRTWCGPGGTVVYSVCTLSAAETTGIDTWLETAHPELEPVLPPGAPFEPHGRGALLLPQRSGAPSGPTDGMFLLRLTRIRPAVEPSAV